MRQYFIEQSISLNDEVILSDEIVHHVKDVLRMKNDDKIRLVDSEGQVFLASLSFVDKTVSAIAEEQLSDNTTGKDIICCAAMVKKEKWELILQKAAELGATKIVPVITDRTIIHLDDKDIDKKLQRYNKICLEACQQSNRSDICTVEKPVKLKNVLQYKQSQNYIAYEKDKNSFIYDKMSDDSICFVIGPEGGFSEKEANYLLDNGFECCSLGSRILRAETAVMYMLSMIDIRRNNL